MPRLQCKCGRYLKSDAKACPKCGRKVTAKMAVEVLPVKTDDRDVKTLNARKLRWAPSLKAHENIQQRFAALRERVRSGHGYFAGVVEALKPLAKMDRDGCWSTEMGPKGETIYVSPKGNRYVKAKDSEKAHLILDYGVRDEKGWVLNGGQRQLIRFRRYDPAKKTKTERKTERLIKRHEKKVKAKKRALKKVRRKIA